MAESKMDDWSLKWLYINYHSTKKGYILGFMVQYMQWIQLDYHLLFFLQIQDGDIQDDSIQTGVLLLSYIHAPLCPRS